MNAVGRTYLAGVAGAAAMSVCARVARSAGVGMDLEMLMGTAFGVPPGPGARAVGQVAQLVTGGALACGYQYTFERLCFPMSPSTGAMAGAAHGALAGVSLALAPVVHPQIPDRMDAPGAFMLRKGRREAVLFVMLHVLFGAIIGAGARTPSNRRCRA